MSTEYIQSDGVSLLMYYLVYSNTNRIEVHHERGILRLLYGDASASARGADVARQRNERARRLGREGN